jgi:hypothetical protein
MRFVAIFALLICTSTSVFAQSQRELLNGSWYFKKGIGSPCDSLILKLEYHFNPDGDYVSWAKMKDGGEHRYTGTYTASNSEATALVDGMKIGPFPYSIKNGILTVTQPEFHCKVELERE